MPLPPHTTISETGEITISASSGPADSIQDDLDNVHLATPSSELNERPGRRSPRLSSGKKIGKWKVKGKGRSSQDPTGECFLLGLPSDVLHLLLCRQTPKALQALSGTCKLLHHELENENIWRQSYMNHYLWEGASRSRPGRDTAQLLVQPCSGVPRGWRYEALNRDAMLHRWTSSKSVPVTHIPSVGLISSISLFYPPARPQDGHGQGSDLVVGKIHGQHTPSKTGFTINGTQQGSSPSATPSRMTHRQKYEALLAANTRPAPYVLSSGIVSGAVVRSDPLSGKVSKGFWGPSRNSNFNLRPRFEAVAQASTVFLPERNQSFVLWGLLTGMVTHTTMVSKHSSAPGTRANSINVTCRPSEAHEGAVTSLWAPEEPTKPMRFVSGGEDGLLKYWEVDSIPQPKGGKRSPAQESTSTLKCLFTSDNEVEPFVTRSDAVKRRQGASPDPITFVACHSERDIVCSLTDDGDLRIWFNCMDPESRRQIRIDIGSEDELGCVAMMTLDAWSAHTSSVATILVYRQGAVSFTRYDISPTTENPIVQMRTFVNPSSGPLTTLRPFLKPTPPIATQDPRPSVGIMSMISSASTSRASTPGPGQAPSPSPAPAPSPAPLDLTTKETSLPTFGRLVVGGDGLGSASIWSWDQDDSSTSGGEVSVYPIRSWEATLGKITAIDMACGIVAVASFDGHIGIFDPLPREPTLLRSFRALHLSPADSIVAASEDERARWYTPKQILLDNDMIVAAMGAKVFAWRAGSGKGRQTGKGEKKGGGKGEARAHNRGMDLRSLHADAADDQELMMEEEEGAMPYEDRNTLQDRAERQHLAALDDLGLEDGDEALQYALMLSMEDQDRDGQY